MNGNSQHANQFVQELAALVDRLAKRDITVKSLTADYAIFGSWVLRLYKNHEAVQIVWDGKDAVVIIESPPQVNQNSPSKWREEIRKAIDVRFEESPVSFVENYLLTRFTK